MQIRDWITEGSHAVLRQPWPPFALLHQPRPRSPRRGGEEKREGGKEGKMRGRHCFSTCSAVNWQDLLEAGGYLQRRWAKGDAREERKAERGLSPHLSVFMLGIGDLPGNWEGRIQIPVSSSSHSNLLLMTFLKGSDSIPWLIKNPSPHVASIPSPISWSMPVGDSAPSLFYWPRSCVAPEDSGVKAAQEGHLGTAQGPSRRSLLRAEPAIKFPATFAAAVGSVLPLSRRSVIGFVLRTLFHPKKHLEHALGSRNQAKNSFDPRIISSITMWPYSICRGMRVLNEFSR